MARLRQELRRFLREWQDDLSGPWRQDLDGVEPDFDAIPEALTLEDDELIFPGRKGFAVEGARNDSHVFRALDNLRPADVNAVLLGQDPYPKAARATGRSFEQGDLPRWVKERSKVAESLRRIIQAVAQFRTNRDSYVAGDAAWADVVDDIDEQRLAIAQPLAFFDHWQAQGILCLNAGLTLSRFEPRVQQAHFALWRPVVRHLLTALVTRQNRPIVFLLWGGVAADTFNTLGIRDAAESAGTSDNLAVVRHPHPAAEDGEGRPMFFRTNTFEHANRELEEAGGTGLRW